MEVIFREKILITSGVENILLFYTSIGYFLNIEEIIFVIAILVLGV